MLCSSYIKMMPKANDSKHSSSDWFTGNSDGSALSHQFFQVIFLGAMWKAVSSVQIPGIRLQNLVLCEKLSDMRLIQICAIVLTALYFLIKFQDLSKPSEFPGLHGSKVKVKIHMIKWNSYSLKHFSFPLKTVLKSFFG